MSRRVKKTVSPTSANELAASGFGGPMSSLRCLSHLAEQKAARSRQARGHKLSLNQRTTTLLRRRPLALPRPVSAQSNPCRAASLARRVAATRAESRYPVLPPSSNKSRETGLPEKRPSGRNSKGSAPMNDDRPMLLQKMPILRERRCPDDPAHFSFCNMHLGALHCVLRPSVRFGVR